MKAHRSSLAVLLTLFLAASAQQAPQTAQQAPEPPKGTARFGTTTQLVVEDVIVKSKDGNPIEGLKASDFTITEDGKPQKISVFEFQKLEEQAEPAPPPKPAAAEPQEEKPPVKPVTSL